MNFKKLAEEKQLSIAAIELKEKQKQKMYEL
jgi:hypothetical protein